MNFFFFVQFPWEKLAGSEAISKRVLHEEKTRGIYNAEGSKIKLF